MELAIRVNNVDMYGFNGRDNHPKKEHEGMHGFVVEVDHWEDTGREPNAQPDAVWFGQPQHGYHSFTVLLENGDVVDLMEHEIEFVGIAFSGRVVPYVPLLEACKKLVNAPHPDHFASRLGDEELDAVNAIKKLVATVTV